MAEVDVRVIENVRALLTGETWDVAFDNAVLDITKIGAPYAAMKPQHGRCFAFHPRPAGDRCIVLIAAVGTWWRLRGGKRLPCRRWRRQKIANQ